MSKTGNKPEKDGEFNDFGGREGGEKHKGPYIHGHNEGGKKGKAWHGMNKKEAC